MSPKTSVKRDRTGGRHGVLLTPGRIAVLLLGVLGLVFVFENTRATEIRFLVPVVTTPLWIALLATGLIGALCGAYFMKRRS
ncbi:LapA family protein [Streptomyces sp. NPDC058457]|uniref:LapA family protein n=1 Tax=Streptomyces sp. NPDC058457 TaxID=3346507 RepID=UPI003645F6E5